MLDDRFIFLGLIIVTAGHIGYLVDTIRGRVQPNRVTFGIWALAPLVALAAQLEKDVGMQALLTFSAGFFPLAVFVASFFNKKAVWKLRRFDLACGGLSLAGIALWLITREGNLAITFAILADGLAALPTVVKAYRFPETEVGWPYLTSAINAGITLLTIDVWTYAVYGFSVYIFTVCFIIFALVQFRIGPRVALSNG